MPKAKILSVGIEIPGGEVEFVPFNSTRSLLDADIVVFDPTLEEFSAPEKYKGKRCFDQHGSFEVLERLAHWRAELREIVEAGKLVLVLLRAPEQVFVYTGEKTPTTSLGEFGPRTNLIARKSSYSAIPHEIRAKSRAGKEIVRTGELGAVSAYWDEFGNDSPFEATIDGDFTHELLKTRTGNATVGASVTSGAGGAMILLPPLRDDFDAGFFNVGDDGDWTCTEGGIEFGRRFVSALVQMQKAISSDLDALPAPDWSRQPEYSLPSSVALRSQILDCTTAIDQLHARGATMRKELARVERLSALLYSKGRELEGAIRDALELFGFAAAPFADGDSAFDVVFSAPEGRFLGEAEGRDAKAIDIKKLSQLERHVQEDFARPEVEEHAMGVLFGNAHRLVDPPQREAFFTPKCISGAQRSRFALVPTPSLFAPARYLQDHDDPEYATLCREAIAAAFGDVVQFPEPPKSSKAT